MRTVWLIPLLLLAEGCQSLRGVGWPSARLADPPSQSQKNTASVPSQAPTDNKLVLVPPEQVAERADGEKWVVELPEGWREKTQPTVLVVPVPMTASTESSTNASEKEEPFPVHSPLIEETEAAIAAREEELLQRLRTIESAVQSLATKVEQVGHAVPEQPPASSSSVSQVMDARDLPYQVGFIK